MSDLLGPFKARGQRRDRAHAIYTALVEQARRPSFYSDLGVPDTVDGRFDLIVLHVFLVVRRLRSIAGQGGPLGQEVFEVMMADMDQSLRVLGVGDLGVGRRVKAMAKAFMGRCQAYDQAMIAGIDAVGLAVERNVFRSGAPAGSAGARSIAAYAVRAAERLRDQDDQAVLEGVIDFGDPIRDDPA